MRTLKNFPYEHILIFGLARTGTAVAHLLLESGLQIRINDRSSKETKEVKALQQKGAEVILGSHPISVLDGIQLIIKNPGIPYEHEIIQIAIKRDIPIITDIELTNKMFNGSITGITGSNGKTTTTYLVEHMLKADHQHVQIAGNIGIPVCEVAPIIDEETKLILELSSFQLLGIQSFRPQISVLLNLYDAHLDYHQTVDNYQQAKFNLFKNQTADDYIVFNADDEEINEAVKWSKAQIIPFSTTEKQPDGAWLDQNKIYFKEEEIIEREKIVLVGEHQLENILAAISVAKLHKVSNEAIRKTLTTFSSVKHRLQFVKNINDRLFYNDSKATNTLATKNALSAFSEPLILLAGGLDRGETLKDLEPYLTKVKHIVVFGENANKFVDLAKVNNIPVTKVNNVTEAVPKAYQISNRKDIILLSPASASWDQYVSFEERGDMFIKAVHNLI
ncbi:MAG TPA: UDP-N-acetylmuramoyl-L-alanine--D-glutamate ligase [Bacillota bacterium]|nr:UDP-N-acetylmuramoyl-L-alanine--D-glutamate ligase [Bacillota bacterium]